MEYLDARRLPGPNVFWSSPGAVLDIACTPDEADAVIPYCEAELRRMLEAVGWAGESIRHRRRQHRLLGADRRAVRGVGAL